MSGTTTLAAALADRYRIDRPLGAGETYDFTFTRSEPARFTLAVTTFIRRQPPREMRVPVLVE